MSYPPAPPPGAGAFAAPQSGGSFKLGLGLSLGPEVLFGIVNVITPDGWPWLLVIGWMALGFVVGLVLVIIESTRQVGAGMLAGAALGVIVAGGSCIGYLATQQSA